MMSRSRSRFRPVSEKMPGPNSRRNSSLTCGSRSTRSRAALSALKNFASGTISRRHSQNVVLPVEIPPVIPMAGIALSYSTWLGLKQLRVPEPSSPAISIGAGRELFRAGEIQLLLTEIDDAPVLPENIHAQKPDHLASAGGVKAARAQC